MDSLEKEEKDQNMKFIAVIPADTAKSAGATVFDTILNPGFGRTIQRGFVRNSDLCLIKN